MLSTSSWYARSCFPSPYAPAQLLPLVRQASYWCGGDDRFVPNSLGCQVRLDQLTGKHRLFIEDEFTSLYREASLERVLHPIFLLQYEMRRKLKGQSWWTRQAEARFASSQVHAMDFNSKVMDICAGRRREKVEKKEEAEDREAALEEAGVLDEEGDGGATEIVSFLREWKQFKGSDGMYWFDGEQSVWEQPEAHKEKMADMLANGWAPRRCKWKEHDDKSGGSYFSDGKISLWEVPTDMILFEMQKEEMERKSKEALMAIEDLDDASVLSVDSVGSVVSSAPPRPLPPPRRPFPKPKVVAPAEDDDGSNSPAATAASAVPEDEGSKDEEPDQASLEDTVPAGGNEKPALPANAADWKPPSKKPARTLRRKQNEKVKPSGSGEAAPAGGGKVPDSGTAAAKSGPSLTSSAKLAPATTDPSGRPPPPIRRPISKRPPPPPPRKGQQEKKKDGWLKQ